MSERLTRSGQRIFEYLIQGDKRTRNDEGKILKCSHFVSRFFLQEV